MTEQNGGNTGVKIELDFRSDWISILKKRIPTLGFGYAVNQDWDDSTISDVYFNLARRLIEPKPRKVVQSREFKCPPEFVRGLEWIKDKASKGGNLNPHLSRQIPNALYNDPLLNDWDIQHLHLGEKIESNGLVTGTGPVLFAKVTSDTFYLLDVMDHGSKYQPWTKKRLVNIIHENWPGSIAVNRLEWVDDIEVNPSEPELGQLRKAGICTNLRMDDGTAFGPIGGGVTASGIGLEVVENTLRYFRLVGIVERYVKVHFPELVDVAKRSVQPTCKALHFRLVDIQDEYVKVIELNNGERTPIKIPLGPPG